MVFYADNKVSYSEKKEKAISYGDYQWSESIINQMNNLINTGEKYFSLDMSRIDFVPLFEWASVVSCIDKFLANSFVAEYSIDLIGECSHLLITPHEYLQFRNGHSKDHFISQAHMDFSERVYHVAGFLEALGTLSVLRWQDTNILYLGLNQRDANFRSFYRRSDEDQTVVLGLTRINEKEDCLQFLDDSKIINWVEAMSERYRFSPLFDSEELWRVFCHELAVNIWEHAKAPGYIVTRIVEPINKQNQIKRWCNLTYPEPVKNIIHQMKSGFLEICVTDSGVGITSTLRNAYLEQIGSCDTNIDFDIDILKFAFDELGTSKNKDESWATDRHALGRILQLVAKYGGALTLRSGFGEIIYTSQEGRFKKLSNNCGYEPQHSRRLTKEYKGTHLQLILPLIPIIQKDIKERQSILYSTLPSGFHPQLDQVVGHIIPLLEKLDSPGPAIGKDDQNRFIRKCKELCFSVIRERPNLEPLILDFSGVNWLPAQFETLLHLLQNVIQNRPVLLVEIDPKLALQIVELEKLKAPTTLNSEIILGEQNSHNDIPEKRFLETYNRIHATILGIDRNGVKYIFGLLNHANYEEALLSLVEKPQDVKKLCARYSLNEGNLNAIFNNINPLFTLKENKWTTVWDKHSIEIQSKRAMSLHFNTIADNCFAWRGRKHLESKKNRQNEIYKQTMFPVKLDTGSEIFNVPWQKEWVKEFFESSRILSRGRYADEVAQRLIYRLEKGLDLIGKVLDDVNILACVTAPALLLATAIYRWWPKRMRPSVADLGYYLMLNPNDNLPVINSSGGIVIIQDVLNKHHMSKDLIASLKKQNKEILCLLSFTKLVDGIEGTRVTNINDGWKKNEDGIPEHSMIELKRPGACNPPTEDDDKNSFWIEPRTLRPFRYSTLRHETRSKPEYNIDRNTRLHDLLEPDNKCLMASGHYVYGNRHFATAIDIQSFLRGPDSYEISRWIADVCEGKKIDAAPWETPRGTALEGDTTVVLMPLHSHIHYIWPQVENLLAQRGRRQPVWFLDATLFLGHGSTYRLPLQLEHQIKETIHNYKKVNPDKKQQSLRILILDDSIVTARTLQTILMAINQSVNNAKKAIQNVFLPDEMPIQWIRYFSIFNLLNASQNTHWLNLDNVGNEFKIPFVFEDYVHLIGTAVYNDRSCPLCKDVTRMEHLAVNAKLHGVFDAEEWANQRIKAIQPISIDNTGFQIATSQRLPRPISILPRIKKKEPHSDRGESNFVDSAIYRFYSLMYMSYPPSDILTSLDYSWPITSDNLEDYNRYRFAVFEWCFRNWRRVVADAARQKFIEYLQKEVRENSFILEELLESLSQQYKDPYIKKFVFWCFLELANLEIERYKSSDDSEKDRSKRTLRLENALNLFLLNIPNEEFEKYTLTKFENDEPILLLKHLENIANSLEPKGLTFTRNFYIRYSRPQRFANPEWALRTIAENLFRGRNPETDTTGDHQLLPRLLKDVQKNPENVEYRRLLDCSLTSFLGALDDLKPYMQAQTPEFGEYQNCLFDSSRALISFATGTLKWLRIPLKDPNATDLPSDIRHLLDEISLSGDFCKSFNDLFHQKVKKIREMLYDRRNKLELTDFEFDFPENGFCEEARALTLIQRIIFFITNWTLEPQRHYKNKHNQSRVEASIGRNENFIVFKLLTGFDTLENTNKMTVNGRKIDYDTEVLKTFGVKFDDEWHTPDNSNDAGIFTSEYKFYVPIGFNPRRPK